MRAAKQSQVSRFVRAAVGVRDYMIDLYRELRSASESALLVEVRASLPVSSHDFAANLRGNVAGGGSLELGWNGRHTLFGCLGGFSRNRGFAGRHLARAR